MKIVINKNKENLKIQEDSVDISSLPWSESESQINLFSVCSKYDEHLPYGLSSFEDLTSND